MYLLWSYRLNGFLSENGYTAVDSWVKAQWFWEYPTTPRNEFWLVIKVGFK